MNVLRTCAACLGLLACGDPLAPDGYRGEVIFRTQGVVQSAADADNWHDLRPVVAFKTNDEPVLQLVDSISVRPTDERGISGDFVLELYDVPPDETLIDFEEHPDWGKTAFGMVAAVPSKHPKRLEYLHKEWTHYPCMPDGSCPCDDSEWLWVLDASTGSDPPVPFGEIVCCMDQSDSPDTCRSVASVGDAQILSKPMLPVAAVVQDFLLFYLTKDAPPGSEFADYVFHAKATGVSAGYHLVKVSPVENTSPPDDDFVAEVVGDEDVTLQFKRDVVPWGINL